MLTSLSPSRQGALGLMLTGGAGTGMSPPYSQRGSPRSASALSSLGL
jgi:hypothetical protein